MTDATEQLLLTEGMCQQLHIQTYLPDVQVWQRRVQVSTLVTALGFITAYIRFNKICKYTSDITKRQVFCASMSSAMFRATFVTERLETVC